jgi:hypothetical protein
MPNHLEQIPPANPNRQFPGCDITLEEHEKADSILDEICADKSEEEQFRQISNLHYQYLNQWRSLPGQETVFRNLNFLTKAWSESMGEADIGKAIAAQSVFSSLAFAKKARILPQTFMPFPEEVSAMSDYNPETIELFSDEAWNGMSISHPRIHGLLDSWLTHLQDVFQVEGNEERVILMEASVALPYVFASASAMTKYFDESFEHDFGLPLAGEPNSETP